MSFYPAREIRPNLWVGSSADSRDKKFLKQHDIQLIINATKTIPFSTKHILGYRVPVDDHPDENPNMIDYFPITSLIIDETLKSGKGVLVHCYAGIQRSCAVAAAYLIYKDHIPARQAMDAVQRMKSEAFLPIPTFAKALETYAKSVV